MTSANPYTSRNMIKDPALFFGRQSEIEEIFQNLENFQNTSIVGERRSGKSSLLWHISQSDVYNSYTKSNERPFLIVFFDLQKVANLSRKTFFKLVAQSLVEQLPDGGATDPGHFDTTQEFFYDILEKAARTHRVVICLDEFETVAANEEFDSSFLVALRSQANVGKVAYITSSRLPLDQVCKYTSQLQGSDFWNIFVTPPTYLGLLKPSEAHELVGLPSKAAGIEFRAPEIDLILELAGCHPLFLQIACYHVFEIRRKKQESGDDHEITSLERSQIRDSFLMGAKPHYEHIWNRLSQIERQILANAASTDPSGKLKETVRSLMKKGLLLADQPLRAFSVTFQLFAEENNAVDRKAVEGVSVVPGVILARTPEVRPQGPAGAAEGVWQPRPAPPAKLEICIGRNYEVMFNLTGPFSLSQFCRNPAKFDQSTLKRFDSRVRSLPQVENWRLEKQEIGEDVFELFSAIPELPQVYTGAREMVASEDFILTFKCPQEMLAFPFEFINCLSSVDEGQKHIVLTHPIRKSILGIRSKKIPLRPDFYLDKQVKVLLVSSNVSGTIRLDRKTYVLPAIPGAENEIDALDESIRQAQERGVVACSVDVKKDVTSTEMKDLLKNGGYDVVHYSGHGMYADSPESSCLFFRGDGGRGGQASIGTLSANELNNQVEGTRIRFMYLSCCQGATTGTPDQLLNSDFLGIAHSLLIGGVPSVLSMRWPLNDEVAILLASTFYTEIFKGIGVDKALLRARKQVQSQLPNDHNWLSPVLVVQGD